RELSLTQDFVAKGVSDQYKWLGGLFGFYKRGLMDAPVTFKDYGIKKLIVENRNDANPYYPISWDDDEFELWSDFVNPTIGVALYHQSSLSIGRWDLSAGLRFDVEHSTLEYHSKCNTGYWIWDATVEPIRQMRKELVKIDDGGKLSKTFVQLLPKFTATYGFVEDKMRIYASVSKGYKAGGFNTQMFSDVLQQRVMGMMGLAQLYDVDEVVTYKPEYSWNYEIGGHAELFGGRLKADMALFYIDCRDQQLTIFPEGTTTGRIMTNAGKTRSYGIELSARYKPIDCLSLDASYGFTDARFREYNNGKEDFSGKKIPYSPENTLYGGANYSVPLRCFIFDSVDLAVNCRAVGDIAWDEANMVSQPFYALLGASVRLNCEKYNMSMDIWGENLTNVQYSTFYFVSIGNAFLQQGKPRRFGITLRMSI
ncbi:MAG: TonB-dependent receptor, partial [Muribaculaceae bacterium]|nr:TonB-dependent receptor [Muribaculaceae bacterium]